MKHNGAILCQLYLHVGYYRILRKKLVTVWYVLYIAMRFCISILPVRKTMHWIKQIYFTAYVLKFKAILKCPSLRDNKSYVVK